MKALKLPLAIALLVLMQACASLSFDQKLAEAYTANTAARSAAAAAVSAGKVSSAEGANVLAITDNARKVLDTAKANKDEASLDLAIAVTKQVQEFAK